MFIDWSLVGLLLESGAIGRPSNSSSSGFPELARERTERNARTKITTAHEAKKLSNSYYDINETALVWLVADCQFDLYEYVTRIHLFIYLYMYIMMNEYVSTGIVSYSHFR